MATLQKPATKFSNTDWFTTNYAVSTNSERQRLSSEQVRQEARQLRNETDIRTRWDQHDNETRLEERAEMIDKWRLTLEKTLADVNAEIDSLKEAKLDAERALEAKNLPLAVTTDCLTIRDGRQNIDNVDDEVENQFKKVSV